MNSEKPDLAALTATVLSAGKAVKSAEQKANEAAKSPSKSSPKIVQFPGEPEFREETGPPPDYEDEARGGSQRVRTEAEPPKSERKDNSKDDFAACIVDLVPFFEGDVSLPQPDSAPVLPGGKCLGYRSAINGISAATSTGKTNVLLALSMAEVAAGGSVVFIDPEDHPRRAVARVASFGGGKEFAAGVTYAHQPTGPQLLNLFDWCAKSKKPTMIIIDGLAAILSKFAIDENENSAVIEFFDKRLRPLAAAGAAVWIADHFGKTTGAGRHARGASGKLDQMDGAVFAVSLWGGVAYGPGKAGGVCMSIAKDRPGGVGIVGERIAKLWLEPQGGGKTRIYWEDLRGEESACEKPQTARQILAPQIRAILEKLATGTANKTELRALPGSADAIDKAVEILMRAEEIEMEKIRGANVYRLRKRADFDPAEFRKESPNTEKTP